VKVGERVKGGSSVLATMGAAEMVGALPAVKRVLRTSVFPDLPDGESA
jgi:hypothetical protein